MATKEKVISSCTVRTAKTWWEKRYKAGEVQNNFLVVFHINVSHIICYVYFFIKLILYSSYDKGATFLMKACRMVLSSKPELVNSSLS